MIKYQQKITENMSQKEKLQTFVKELAARPGHTCKHVRILSQYSSSACQKLGKNVKN